MPTPLSPAELPIRQSRLISALERQDSAEALEIAADLTGLISQGYIEPTLAAHTELIDHLHETLKLQQLAQEPRIPSSY